MVTVPVSASRLGLLSVVILVAAVLLCAIFMPAMAMAALTGCVAVVGFASLARRALAPPQAPEPCVLERFSTPVSVMGTGPPVPVPLRT